MEPDVVRIMQRGIENTVSINRVTRTTNPDGAIEGYDERNNAGDDCHSDEEQTTRDSIVNLQYVFDPINRPLETPTRLRYDKCWWGYTEDDDTTEPAKTPPTLP